MMGVRSRDGGEEQGAGLNWSAGLVSREAMS